MTKNQNGKFIEQIGYVALFKANKNADMKRIVFNLT
jgi:hypothetical protein